MKPNHSILVVFLICIFTAALYCHAEEVKVVEGLIEDVTDESIKVGGKYYNISGVPLKDASEKDTPKDRLKKGKMVKILFQDNKITTVILDESMID